MLCISVCVKAAGCSREEKDGKKETRHRGKAGRGSTYKQQGGRAEGGLAEAERAGEELGEDGRRLVREGWGDRRQEEEEEKRHDGQRPSPKPDGQCLK